MESFFAGLKITPVQFWFGFVPLVATLALGLLAVGVFALRTAARGLPRTGRIIAQGGTPFLGHFVMEFYYWLTSPVTRWLVRHNVTPNAITTASLVLGVGAAVALSMGHFGLGGWLILLSATMDAFDGIVARARGMSSESGDFWDSMADRVCDAAALIGIAFYWRENVVLFYIAMFALVSSFSVSYARAKAESYGVKSYGGVMQRHERVVYLGLGTAVAPLIALITEPGDTHPEYWLTVVAVVLVAFFSTYTAVRRVTSTFGNLKSREKQGKGGRNHV